MTETVFLERIDEVNIKVYSSDSVARELYDLFTFKPKDFQYSPKFKRDENGRRKWDGRIRLFKLRSGIILAGLRTEVEKYCRSRGYEVKYLSDFSEQEFSIKEGHDFIRSLNLPKDRVPHDYQVAAFVKSVRQKRRLTLLPTASGKSLVIYFLAAYYPGKKLIIVPTLGLIHQMAGDFVSYGCDENRIHKVYEGQEKESDRDIWVSTWQSLTKMSEAWFRQFNVVIGDEAHGFQAKTLMAIMNKLNRCKYRFGLSGTLDGAQVNEMTLTGLFGPIKRSVTTKELMDRGTLSTLEIKMIILKHPEEECHRLVDCSYQDEIDYIVGCEKRNKFIKNLALSLQGNTLIIFDLVDKHGSILYDMILEGAGEDRKVFFVYRKVEGEERDAIRAIVEEEKNAIICASRQTFGTGANIRNLHNIIFASPRKGLIPVLQPIGRGLRKSDVKFHCCLFDIADDLSCDGWYNFAMRHAKKRMDIYHSECFNYKVYSITMEG
jgi:superfamily II DNA or RNA helicase